MRTYPGLLISMLCLASLACTAQDAQPSPDMDDVVVAVEVVRRDFQQRIAQPQKGDQDLARYLSEIGNYKMTVHQQGSTVVIGFAPLPVEEKGRWRGGGGVYEVDLRSRTILRFEWIK